jgi:hypothetical protein
MVKRRWWVSGGGWQGLGCGYAVVVACHLQPLTYAEFDSLILSHPTDKQCWLKQSPGLQGEYEIVVTEEELMPDKKKVDTAAVARASLARMSDEKRAEIRAIVQKALDERDLPKFEEGLAKLGYDETSAEYEKLLRLWHEHARASRR